jgi:DNA-binding transcriptional LysR family regulator
MDLHALNWEDVHVFAVAARSRSYRAAAATLGSTHPTVRRRVASLEASLGFRLFQSDAPGLHPTVQGQELLRAAEQVEEAMSSFARQARAADSHLRGPLTATMSISMAVGLAPALAAFSEAWPEIVLTVDTSTTIADLSAMEADVAIRAVPVGQTPDPSLVGRRAARVFRAAYGVDGAAGWIASLDRPGWVRHTPFPDEPVRGVMPSVALRLEACKLGMGMAMLPCFMADPHLPRLSDPEPLFDIWVLVHPDLRRNPRLKLFRDAMVTAIADHADELQGVAPDPPPDGAQTA